MSNQNGNGGCFIVLLIVLFSEALLPIVCAPLLLPFLIADADAKTQRLVLTVLAVFVIAAIWFWLKSRSRRKKGDRR
jgi:hypothetical protein